MNGADESSDARRPGAYREPGTPTATGQSAAVETVAGDLACVSCRYNLRTLRFDGRCPECGAAVSRSLPGPAQSDADPRWLRSLVTGLTLLGVSAATVVLQLACVASSVATRGSAAELVGWLLIAVAVGAFVTSAWKLGAAEPGGPPRTGSDGVLRTGALVMAAAAIGAVVWHQAIGSLLLLPIAFVFYYSGHKMMDLYDCSPSKYYRAARPPYSPTHSGRSSKF